MTTCIGAIRIIPMAQTYLVTGAAGFIGKKLCEFLLRDNENKVVGFDNFATGSRANVSQLLQNPRFKFV
jgi:UDP-N-acetylglucosamine 4-epimerase